MAVVKKARQPRKQRPMRGRERRSHATAPLTGDASSREPNPDPLPQLSRWSRKEVIAALVLGVMVFASYVPAILGGFVWDDSVFTDEPLVRQWNGIWRIWSSPGEIKNEGHYWPLVYSSFWLEHKLWGFTPIGYHVVNVLLHGLICLLLWRLMLALAVPGAWLIAAVFAVHPLHVESVAWVIERKDLPLRPVLPCCHLGLASIHEGPQVGALLACTGSVCRRDAIEVDCRHPAGRSRHPALVEEGRVDLDGCAAARSVLRHGGIHCACRPAVLPRARGSLARLFPR